MCCSWGGRPSLLEWPAARLSGLLQRRATKRGPALNQTQRLPRRWGRRQTSPKRGQKQKRKTSGLNAGSEPQVRSRCKLRRRLNRCHKSAPLELWGPPCFPSLFPFYRSSLWCAGGNLYLISYLLCSFCRSRHHSGALANLIYTAQLKALRSSELL